MSVVFSIRIPKKLKKLMDECKGIDWAEEVKAFLNKRVRELLMKEYLKTVSYTHLTLPTILLV